jgi:hypothetical protein
MSKTKKLTEADFIRLFREEWQAKMQKLSEDSDIDFAVRVPGEKGGKGKSSFEEVPVISPGLKVRHKTSKIRYTVRSVSEKDCVLRTPEGKDFLVDANKLEKEYERD